MFDVIIVSIVIYWCVTFISFNPTLEFAILYSKGPISLPVQKVYILNIYILLKFLRVIDTVINIYLHNIILILMIIIQSINIK